MLHLDGDGAFRVSDRVRLGLAVAVLAVAGLSLGAGLHLQSGIVDVEALVVRNAIGGGERRLLLASMASGAMLLLTVAGLRYLRTRRAADVFHTAALASPLAVVWALPLVFGSIPWRRHEITLLLLVAILGGITEVSVRHAATAIGAAPSLAWRTFLATHRRVRSLAAWGPILAVTLMAAAFSYYIGYHAIEQHRRLHTAAFDLGIYDNLMFNALHGEPFHSPVLFGPDGGNYIAGHAEFAMVLFTPLYAIFPRAEFLLVLQSVMMGAAALPLFFFARTQLPAWLAACVAGAYLLYAPLHGPLFYDFHWLPLAVFFHFLLYYAIATNRLVLIIVNVAVLTLIREDVSVGLCVLGVFLFATGTREKLGLALAAYSVIAFITIKFVIMPMAGTWWFSSIYKDLIAPGEKGYASVVRTIVSNPAYFLETLLTKEKLAYSLHMLAPLLFIPLRRWQFALLIVPGFFFTLMTTGYDPTVSIAFQYTTHWIPYLFLAVVLMGGSLYALEKSRAGATGLVAGVLLAVTAHSYVYGAVLHPTRFKGGFGVVPFSITPKEQQTYEAVQALSRRIPDAASVAASEELVAHVSARRTVYSLRLHSGAVDYLFVRKATARSSATRKNLRKAFGDNAYTLVEKREGIYLFQRGRPSPATAAAKRELGI